MNELTGRMFNPEDVAIMGAAVDMARQFLDGAAWQIDEDKAVTLIGCSVYCGFARGDANVSRLANEAVRHVRRSIAQKRTKGGRKLFETATWWT